MNEEMSVEELALQGDVRRMKGDAAGAVSDFTRAIDQLTAQPGPSEQQKQGARNRLLAWLYARRGAAKSDLVYVEKELPLSQPAPPAHGGWKSTSIEDFQQALKLRPNYPWALGQMGEAYRRYARLLLTPVMMDGKGVRHDNTHFEESIAGARACFQAAPRNYWTLAHWGVTELIVYWRDLGTWDLGRTPGEEVRALPKHTAEYHKAKELLLKSIELKPSYIWALANLALLCAIGREYAQASGWLAQLNKYDLAHTMDVETGLMKLDFYQERWTDLEEKSWDAIRKDPLNPFGYYFLTTALHQRNDPAMPAAARTSLSILLQRLATDVLVACNLLSLSGQEHSKLYEKLAELRRDFVDDIEARSFHALKNGVMKL